MRRDTWSDLATFATIAEAGSFTKAATALGVSPSALSHAMRGLEDRLGIRLLNRSTRSVAPTEAGERLLLELQPAIAGLDGALAEIEERRERPAGRVRVSAHRTAATTAILPRLPRFMAEFPDVQVELAIEDGLVDIVAAGFDVGVRHEHVLDRDMISVRIGEPQRVAIVATPGYLARAGRPTEPRDLLGHRCLVYRYTSSGTIHRWQFEKDGQRLVLDPPPTFVSNDVDLVGDAALAGMGIACLSGPQAAPHVAAGSLVRVLEEWCPLIPANYLYCPGRRQVSGALRAFIDAMRRPTA